MLLNQKVISQAHKTRGYLEKKSSGFISIWQRRYFIILDHSLSYFGDETLQEARKTIQLPEINAIKIIEHLEFHLVTKKRIYELRADTESNRDLWVASLNILTNQKSISQHHHSKLIHFSDNKIVPTRPHSKPKKKETTGFSPPPLRKMSSMVESSLREDDYCSDQTLFLRMGLPKLSNALKEEHFRNKLIMMRMKEECYFILSCKTPLGSHEDDNFLPEDIIRPLQPNTLYYFEQGKLENSKVIQICRCSDIESIQEEPHTIILILANRRIRVELNHRKMEVEELFSLPKRIKHAIAISKEYFNSHGIKLKRNIDKMLYKYDSKEMGLAEIVKREMEKCFVDNKEGQVRNEFRKNLELMRRTIREVIACCQVLGQARIEFRDKFIREFHHQMLNYINKTKGNLQKSFNLTEQKKLMLLLFDIWKLVKDIVKDAKMFDGAIAMHKRMMQKYQQQIVSKVDSCFSLKESEVLQEINMEIKGESQIISQMNTFFYSNKIYRQFHIDIRLVLYEFLDMPVHEKIFDQYLTMFRSVFKHIAEETFKFIDKWKNEKLILGTCNEIEFIKNSLFQEMYNTLSSEYPTLGKTIKNKCLRELETEVSNVEILLVKQLFVMTFNTIDREMLSKHFDCLAITQICESILGKLRLFSKINKYVKRNIFEASFEEICYFYYTNIIKFNRSSSDCHHSSEYFIKKIAADIKAIGEYFEGHIHNEKIYAHLKDLNLLKEFIQCDLSQVKKICQTLKKEFGNSFTENAAVNLLSLRDMNLEMRDNLATECSLIVKSSSDTPEDISFGSSSFESFLDNWNNARSRKSTLTLSLNQFYQNQHSIYLNKHNCSVWKQGYLTKKKITKTQTFPEVVSFFHINHSRLEEYESENKEEIMTVYQLHNVKKCILHPDKNYVFIVEFNEFKLHFKAETSDEAKEWIKNIYEEIGALNTLKEIPMEKERPSNLSRSSNTKDATDPSTMDSVKTMKDRSLDKSTNGSPMMKMGKRASDKDKEQSPEKMMRVIKSPLVKQEVGEDGCVRCSKGFFF